MDHIEGYKLTNQSSGALVGDNGTHKSRPAMSEEYAQSMILESSWLGSLTLLLIADAQYVRLADKRVWDNQTGTFT